MLDFCKTMQPDLSNYSTDEVRFPLFRIPFICFWALTTAWLAFARLATFPQAWPSMLDDFVAWKNPAAAAQEGNTNVENDE